MGQIYGAEPYLYHLWGRTPPVPPMGQSSLSVTYGADLWGRAPPSAIYGAEPSQLSSTALIYGTDLWGRAIPVPSMGRIYGADL